jgi:serine/threonine protein kinase
MASCRENAHVAFGFVSACTQYENCRPSKAREEEFLVPQTNDSQTPERRQDASWVGEVVEKFETAWEQGQNPTVEDYLPHRDSERQAVLLSLIHVDLERRLKARQAARIENYLRRFPELSSDRSFIMDLVRSEWSQRRKFEPELTPAEYARRFPELGDEIRAQLEPGGTSGACRSTSADSTVSMGATPANWLEGKGQQVVASSARGLASRYHVVRFHRRGALGEVHLAQDQELHREVALKRLQSQFNSNPQSRRRFLLEAEITARLEHPGIVPVHGLVQDEHGLPCYAMRFIRGESLKETIERFYRGDPSEQRLEFRQLLTRFVAVCDAVAYAHSRGVLHRDIKPANIMLGKYGETLLVDWGLAKPFEPDEQGRCAGEENVTPTDDADTRATMTGELIGTPAYMSPEQADGRWEAVGPASDVYSLGATLYSLLTGKERFPTTKIRDILDRLQRGDFLAPREVRSSVPAALEAVCLKALALRPEDRYPSALALARDIENWLADETVSAYREPVRDRLWRWGRKHKAIVGSIAAASLAIILTVGLALFITTQSRNKDRHALLETFQNELKADDWTVAHVDKLRELVAKIGYLSQNDAQEAQERLYDAFSRSIQKELLEEERLSTTQADRIQEQIERILEGKPDLRKSLRTNLARRKAVREERFELAPPSFAGLEEVFDPALICSQGNALRVAPRLQNDYSAISSLLSCPARAHLEALFPVESWTTARRLSLLLNHSEFATQGVSTKFPMEAAGFKGYFFVLCPATGSQDPSSAKTGTLGEAQKAGGRSALQIWRNGRLLRQRVVSLPEGALRLSADREGDRLSCQVNDLSPLVVRDLFPLSATENSRFGLVLPAECLIERLYISRQFGAGTASALELGDYLYERAEFARAHDYFQWHPRKSETSEVGQEIRCKEALCLLQRNRLDEAVPLLEKVAGEEGKRWPIVAACQLWLIKLKQKRTEDVNRILAFLSPQGSEELATYISEDVLHQIAAYYPAAAVSNWVRYQPDRLRQQEKLVAVLDLLPASDEARRKSKLALTMLYHFEERHVDALKTAEELLQDSFLSTKERVTVLGEWSWLLSEEGNAERALHGVDQWLLLKDGGFRKEYLALLPNRARILTALKKPIEAQRALDYYFANAPSNDANFYEACLLRGFLYEDAGKKEEAQASWRQGYLRARTTPRDFRLLHVSILASLTGALTEEDANKMVDGVLEQLVGKNPLTSFFRDKLLNVHEVTSALRDLYRSERGHAYARKITFQQNIPAREFYSVQMLLFATQACHNLAFPDSKQWSLNEEFVWEAMRDIYEAYITGKLRESPDFINVEITMFGSADLFKDGLFLEPNLRAKIAYILGQRYRVLNRPERSREFFRIALNSAAPESKAHQLTVDALAPTTK